MPKNCSDYFDIWWDTKKFNWENALWSLVCHCSEHFNHWWKPKQFDWDHVSPSGENIRDLLRKHCDKHKNTWAEDYVIYKLLSEGKK